MREEYREGNKAVGWIWLWIIVGFLLVSLLGIGIWGFTVATSGIKGQGDGVIVKNSADNWLDAQARFVENYSEIEGTLVKIEVAADALSANPDDATLKQNYQGTVNYCISVVNDYNADALNYLRKDFIAAGLPDHIDPDTCVPLEVP